MSETDEIRAGLMQQGAEIGEELKGLFWDLDEATKLIDDAQQNIIATALDLREAKDFLESVSAAATNEGISRGVISTLISPEDASIARGYQKAVEFESSIMEPVLTPTIAQTGIIGKTAADKKQAEKAWLAADTEYHKAVADSTPTLGNIQKVGIVGANAEARARATILWLDTHEGYQKAKKMLRDAQMRSDMAEAEFEEAKRRFGAVNSRIWAARSRLDWLTGTTRI